MQIINESPIEANKDRLVCSKIILIARYSHCHIIWTGFLLSIAGVYIDVGYLKHSFIKLDDVPIRSDNYGRKVHTGCLHLEYIAST